MPLIIKGGDASCAQPSSAVAARKRGLSARDLGRIAVGALAAISGASAQVGTASGGTDRLNGELPALPRKLAHGYTAQTGAFSPLVAPVSHPSLAPTLFKGCGATVPENVDFAPAPSQPMRALPSKFEDASGRNGLGHNGSRDDELARHQYAMPLRGCITSGYSAPMTIGGQSFYSLLDTGSGALVVASSECTTCNTTSGFELSTRGCDLDKPIDLIYGAFDQNYIKGREVKDEVAIAGLNATSLVFVDALAQKGLFYPDSCVVGRPQPCGHQAQLGIGRRLPGTGDAQAYYSSLEKQLKYSAFSVAFCDLDGRLYLGGYPADRVIRKPFYVPLASPTQSPYLAIRLRSFKIGNNTLGSPQEFGPMPVDTGSSSFRLPTKMFSAAVNMIAQVAPEFNVTFFSEPGFYLRRPGNTTLASINERAPSLRLNLGGDNSSSSRYEELQLLATNSYLNVRYDVDHKTMFLTPALRDGGDEAVFGMTAMRNHMIIFDIEKQKLGIAPSKGICGVG